MVDCITQRSEYSRLFNNGGKNLNVHGINKFLNIIENHK